MDAPTFKAELRFSANEPFRVVFSNAADELRFRQLQQDSKVRAGLILYLARLQELTREKVPETLIQSLPVHFRQHTRALAVFGPDSLVIRYEPNESLDNDVVVMVGKDPVAALIPQMTLGLVLMAGPDGNGLLPPNLTTPTISFDVCDSAGKLVRQVVDGASVRIQIPETPRPNQSQRFPPHLELIRNQFYVHIQGVEVQEGAPNVEGRSFTSRGNLRFPGTWDALSVYQWADREQWRTADFSDLAERHFYQEALRAATTEHNWMALSSQQALRTHYRNVLAGLDSLLAKQEVLEEELQQYLLVHPEVLVPGYRRVLPKVPLGAHVTDFVIEDATGDYLLVELENPNQELFIKSGHRSSKLTHAVGQIEDWTRYIQDNKSTVEREVGLAGISATPQALVVIGRSKNVSAFHRRKLQINQGQIEVLTYDDLRDRFAKTVENLIGMLRHPADQQIAYHC